jgi:hypothetical protein
MRHSFEDLCSRFALWTAVKTEPTDHIIVCAAGRVNECSNVQQLADEGIQVGYTSSDGWAWAEIDDPLDLTFAQRATCSRSF